MSESTDNGNPAPDVLALLKRVARDDLGDVQTAVELAMDAREILKANARLIAAAPTMAEALREVLAEMMAPELRHTPRLEMLVRTVLSDAEGGAA